MHFLWGALAMASWTAALFFLRFWRQSRDRLFFYFFSSFLVLSVSWLVLALSDPGLETRPYVYLVRLLAFCLMITGIVDKNRKEPRGVRTKSRI
jgi:hypothetical protein